MRLSYRIASTSVGIGLFLGCSGPSTEQESLSFTQQAVNVCAETVPTNRFVDGIPAYAQCATTTGAIYSNNGVDTATTSGGTDWVRTQFSGGYQCTELAHRYLYFHWNVSWIPNGNAGTWCDTTPPSTSGVVQSTSPAHGDLIVFAPGSCGADSTTGHVALVDVVNATTVTIVEQNSAGRRNTATTCAKCFLHVVANTGSGGAGGATSTGGSASTAGASATGGVANTGGSKSTGGTKASGGSPAASGGSSSATGGKANVGGAVSASGGTLTSGGSPPVTGGKASSGGVSATTGGALSTGGSSSSSPVLQTGGLSNATTTSVVQATGGAGVTGSNGGGSTADSTATSTAAAGSPSNEAEAGSCGCRVPRSPSRLPSIAALGLLGILMLRFRRTRL